LGLRIGLRFVESIKGEKRRVRRLAGGILVFGDRMDLLKSQTIPHQDGSPTGDIQADNRLTYQTASKRLQNESTISRYIQQSVFAGESNKRPREGISSTKVSRGDCPSFEPL
jgi:hypothetical protein